MWTRAFASGLIKTRLHAFQGKTDGDEPLGAQGQPSTAPRGNPHTAVSGQRVPPAAPGGSAGKAVHTQLGTWQCAGSRNRVFVVVCFSL